VKLANHLLWLGFYHLGDEGWDLLNDIYESHRWAPVFFVLWNYLQQKISAVSQRRRAELQELHVKRLPWSLWLSEEAGMGICLAVEFQS
jgi:hypothetical protein